MATPVSYTLKTFAEFMRGVVQDSIADTGWTTGAVGVPTDAGAFAEPINDVLLDMGLSDVAQFVIGTILEARLRARVAVWLAVTENKVPLYDAGGAQRTLERSQIFDHAYAMLHRSEAKLALYLRDQQLNMIGGVPTSESARVRIVFGSDDPYNPND